MKYFVVASLGAMLLASGAPAQQTIDPAANSHVKDNATFGTEKPPKKGKNPTTRTVSGQVTDETGQVLQGALVTLTDKKTNQKTNFFTKKDGHYQFADLSFTRNYEVQARYKDKASVQRRLSEYDHTPRPVRILEIDTGSPATSATAANQPAPPK